MAEDKETNSLKWKKILSLLRKGDYAHPGEEEAIEKTFKPIPKGVHQNILDVGCGMGGTASYVQQHGWGNVVGIDLNQETIDCASKKYPEVSFHQSDVLSLPEIIKDGIALIYLFNSFYAFDDQSEALKMMNEIAAPDCRLVIFDYVDRGGYQDEGKAEPVIPYPLNIKTIGQELEKGGWQLEVIEDYDKEYISWYKELVNRIDEKKEKIIKVADQRLFKKVRGVYAHILSEIERGALGGAVVRARKCR